MRKPRSSIMPHSSRGGSALLSSTSGATPPDSINPVLNSTAMLRVAIGFRMHSGWGVMVAVDEHYSIVERQRVEIAHDTKLGGRQPYHHARDLPIEKAEDFLSRYLAACERSASEAVESILSGLKSRSYRVAGVGLILASARVLPPLPQILAAHPLIHTAEGQLFRNVIRQACEAFGIPVAGLPEKELSTRLEKCLGPSTGQSKQAIEKSGRSLGSPWDSDHKHAAMAACVALIEFSNVIRA